MLLILALLLVACGEPDGDQKLPDASSSASEFERVLGPFLSPHWRLPVPAQGEAPVGFSDAERSLDPQICGACHPKQLAEWRTSLHAAAFSPGFAGQLVEGALAHPAEIRACQRCHAPLAEQQPFNAALAPEALFDAELRAQGIVCASCHVRSYRHFGPPRRAELPPLPATLPHGGFEEREEYLDSRFCAACHQFFDDAGANGKPVENTYKEWLASPQAEAGRQCQDCHMPDRQHLWRGIHEPEMVRAAIDVELSPLTLSGSRLEAVLVLRNRDVGHAFPTYVTPRVELVLVQRDAAGEELDATRLSAVIGRQVDLGSMREIFDTRVRPGESVKLEYAVERAEGAAELLGRVRVDPDFHYRAVFDSLLDTLRDAAARAQIEEARRRISTTPYTLVEIRRELPPG